MIAPTIGECELRTLSAHLAICDARDRLPDLALAGRPTILACFRVIEIERHQGADRPTRRGGRYAPRR
jgi:hypothetical protein